MDSIRFSTVCRAVRRQVVDFPSPVRFQVEILAVHPHQRAGVRLQRHMNLVRERMGGFAPVAVAVLKDRSARLQTRQHRLGKNRRRDIERRGGGLHHRKQRLAPNRPYEPRVKFLRIGIAPDEAENDVLGGIPEASVAVFLNRVFLAPDPLRETGGQAAERKRVDRAQGANPGSVSV